MKESSLKITKIIIRLLTALSFALFTAYQVFLTVQISEQRAGRLIGIAFYVLLTVASFLALVHKRGFRVLRSVLLVGGLFALFAMRLLNTPRILGSINASYIPSVLSGAVYIASQLGTLLLAIYYLAVRTNKKIKNKRKLTMILMTVSVVLYASVLIMECVLIMKYRVNIDLTRKYTVLSRLLYFFGFAGTAVNFMLPSTRGESITEQYINKEQSDADVLVASPEKDKSRSDKDKKRNPVLDNADIVFSNTKSRAPHSNKRKR